MIDQNNSNQLATSAAIYSLTAEGTALSGWAKVEAVYVSGSDNIDFINLQEDKQYQIQLIDVDLRDANQANNSGFIIRFSGDNGVTWISGSTAYRWHRFYQSSSGTLISDTDTDSYIKAVLLSPGFVNGKIDIVSLGRVATGSVGGTVPAIRAQWSRQQREGGGFPSIPNQSGLDYSTGQLIDPYTFSANAIQLLPFNLPSGYEGRFILYEWVEK